MKALITTLLFFSVSISLAQVVKSFDVIKSLKFQGNELETESSDGDVHFFVTKNSDNDQYYVELFNESSFELIKSTEVEVKSVGKYWPKFRVGSKAIYVFSLETNKKLKEAYIKVATVDKSSLQVSKTKTLYTFENTKSVPDPGIYFSDDNDNVVLKVIEIENKKQKVMTYLYQQLEKKAVWNINEIAAPFMEDGDELSEWITINVMNSGNVFFEMSKTGKTGFEKLYLSTHKADYSKFIQHAMEIPIGYEEGRSDLRYDDKNDVAYLYNTLHQQDVKGMKSFLDRNFANVNCAIVIKEIKISTGEILDGVKANLIKDNDVVSDLIPFSHGSLISGRLSVKSVSKSDEDWYILFNTSIRHRGANDKPYFTDCEDHLLRVNGGKIIGSIHLKTTRSGWWPWEMKTVNGKSLMTYNGSVSSLDKELLTKNALEKNDKIWSIEWVDMSNVENHMARDINISAVLRDETQNLRVRIYDANQEEDISDILFYRTNLETNSFEVGNLILN